MKIATILLFLLPPLQEKDKSKDPDVRRVSFKAENSPLSKIVGDLQKETGIPIECDEEAMKRINSDDSLVSIAIDDLSLTSTLKLIFGARNFKVLSVAKKKVLIQAGNF